MKKILLMFSLIFAMSVNAQTFDEALLVGTWKPTTMMGTLPYKIESFTSITLGEYYDEWGDRASGLIAALRYEGGGWVHDEAGETVLDFYISNNNKLHIIVSDDYALRFVIEELSETALKVKTYDGACSITFTKEGSTRVASVANTSTQTTTTYNLNGQKIDSPQPNTIYIQNGQKKVMQK